MGAAPHERKGITVRGRQVPVDRAGLYVPGWRGSYPSSVLMTAVPARVAGHWDAKLPPAAAQAIQARQVILDLGSQAVIHGYRGSPFSLISSEPHRPNEASNNGFPAIDTSLQTMLYSLPASGSMSGPVYSTVQ